MLAHRVVGQHRGKLQRQQLDQRGERQAQADRRVARQQEQAVAFEDPALRTPAPTLLAGLARQDRHHETGRRVEAVLEHAHQPLALSRIGELVVLRIDADGKLLLGQHEMDRILIGRHRGSGRQPQLTAECRGKVLRIGNRCRRLRRLGVDQVGIAPERLAVAAPVDGEGPARQALARVPLALAVVQQAARGEAFAQAAYHLLPIAALGRAQRRQVPLQALHVVDGHEGRLAAHAEAHVAGRQLGIDRLAGRIDLAPLLLGVGLGDARRLQYARQPHVEAELHLGPRVRARDGRRADRARRRRQRDVPFAGQQPRSRVEPDPAGAGDVDLRPGVQIGKVLRGTGRALQRLHVGLQLDQVARHEAGGETQPAQDLHQQPSGVAAGAGRDLQRLVRRLHAGLHADAIGDVATELAVEVGDEVDRSLGRNIEALHIAIGELHRPKRLEVGLELVQQQRIVLEWPLLGRLLDEEVERIDDGHVGDQIDADAELARLVGHHHARQEVAERILLPVDEVRLGRDLQRVGQDRRAAVRRRAQAHHLRRQRYRAIVGVRCAMSERDMEAHATLDEVGTRAASTSRARAVDASSQ